MTRRLMQMLFFAVLLCGAHSTGHAKSIFNLNLIGSRVESGDVRAVALGGGIHLIADSLGILQYNPAMLTYARRVTIAASQFMGTSSSRSDELDERDGAYKFTGIAVAFPFIGPTSMGLDYRAGTDPTGQFSTPFTSESGVPYDEQFERSGGLASYTVSVASDIGPRVKLGAGALLETGRITDTWRIGFDPADGKDAFSQQRRMMRGYGVRAGVVARPIRRVALGVTYRSRIDLDTDVTILNTNTSANDAFEETTVLPEQWTLSGVWAVTSNWIVHAAGEFSDFKKFEGLAFPPDRLQSQLLASAGAEQRRGPLGIPLRFSVSYERLPFTLPAGEDVASVSGTLGTGLNINRGKAKIDLALRVGQTGSLNTNGFEDRFVRFYVGVAGSEAWSRKRGDDF